MGSWRCKGRHECGRSESRTDRFRFPRFRLLPVRADLGHQFRLALPFVFELVDLRMASVLGQTGGSLRGWCDGGHL